MSNKEKAEIVLSCVVGRSWANDTIYQGELIDKDDITKKLSDVSNNVVNETNISFIELYCLGNTYDSITQTGKTKSWRSCSAFRKKLSNVCVVCLRCLCLIDKMHVQIYVNDYQTWICFNCWDVIYKSKWFYLKILDKLSTITKCFCL